MRISKANFLLISILLFSNTHCISARENIDAATLLGTWQEGLTGNVKKLPADAPERLILLGDILEFRENHTFRIYPRCGQEREALSRRGLEFLDGEWTLVDNRKLAIQTKSPDKSFQKATDIGIESEELRFYSEQGKPQAFGRYDGPVPQKCPERPLRSASPSPIKSVPSGLANGCKGLQLLNHSPPKYPIAARRKNQNGWVIVRFNLSPEGVPSNVRIHDASPEGVFDAEVLDAMRNFKYSPSEYNGQDCFHFFRFQLND